MRWQVKNRISLDLMFFHITEQLDTFCCSMIGILVFDQKSVDPVYLFHNDKLLRPFAGHSCVFACKIASISLLLFSKLSTNSFHSHLLSTFQSNVASLHSYDSVHRILYKQVYDQKVGMQRARPTIEEIKVYFVFSKRLRSNVSKDIVTPHIIYDK